MQLPLSESIQDAAVAMKIGPPGQPRGHDSADLFRDLI